MRSLHRGDGVTLPRAGIAAAVIVLLLDQLVKWYVTGPLDLDGLAAPAIELLPIFRLHFVANTGVSLGWLRADNETARWLLVAMTGLIAAGVLVWMWREPRRGDQLALGIVLGGALGNIADRARLGYVIDYADLHFGGWSPFLVFNLGDAAITVGVLILLARALLIRERPKAPVSVENDDA